MAPFLVLYLSYYTSMTILIKLSLIAICNSKCDQTSDLWQQQELASEFESNLRNTMDWCRKWLINFNAGKIQLVLITLLLLMWKLMDLFMRKNHPLKFWVWHSLLNWIQALTLSLLLKLPLRKFQTWFVLWSFFLLRLLCIAIHLPYGLA